MGLLTIGSAGHVMDEQAVFDRLKYRIEVDEDGTRRYYNTAGQLHRENCPAVEWASGVKSWWLNGQRHRSDGPAVEGAVGDKMWYINGEELSEDEFNQAVKQNV